jgi:RNA polymerase sigma factor (sigma-70 family)
MRKTDGFIGNTGVVLSFVKFRPLLRRLLARIVKPQDIDDIVQETYIRVWTASEKTEIVNPKSFMLKTAQNLAYNSLATAWHRRVDLEEDFSEIGVELLLTRDLESQFESNEKFQGFCKAVEALPQQCRRAFVLSKVYGLSQQEIAAQLEISESTVEKHIAKGYLQCREAMLRMGHLDAGLMKKKAGHGKK